MGSEPERAIYYQQTYLVTAPTRKRSEIFRAESCARLFIGTLDGCPGRDSRLYEFSVTADRALHLMAPLTSSERAVRYLQGGYSDGAGKEPGANMEVGQKRVSSRPVRGGDHQVPPRTSASGIFPLSNQDHNKTKSSAR